MSNAAANLRKDVARGSGVVDNFQREQLTGDVVSYIWVVM
jgi:hypothetical protein